MKGAIDVQDDYNRFIQRSVLQAQCGYEDIFTDGGCCGKLPDSDNEDSRGCKMTMPDSDNNGCYEKNGSPSCEKNVPVMAFVEMQPFGRMYNEAEGLCRGTMFPALDKPFTGRGGCR
jgi:hypothetical protein